LPSTGTFSWILGSTAAGSHSVFKRRSTFVTVYI
jgi:hypothetical protein